MKKFIGFEYLLLHPKQSSEFSNKLCYSFLLKRYSYFLLVSNLAEPIIFFARLVIRGSAEPQFKIVINRNLLIMTSYT